MIDPATIHDLAEQATRLVDQIDACVPVLEDDALARLKSAERQQRTLLVSAGIGADTALVHLRRAASAPPPLAAVPTLSDAAR